MVPNWVLFGEIVRRVFLTFLSEYVEMVLSYSVSHPIKYHIYFSAYTVWDVPLMILFVDVVSVATVVYCYWFQVERTST